MRKLASIQKITALYPIPKADRIEVARILGWDVVVQKGLYKVGDLVVYFEIDSILPEHSWCEFLRDRKFRVRTIKLRKQISQGLCVPIEECFSKSMAFDEGVDVTAALKVTKFDPAAAREQKENVCQRQSVPHSWMIRFSLTRRLHQFIWPRKKGSWPEWFPKTDENRVQNIRDIEKFTHDRLMYATEKLDGQSVTMFYERNFRTGLFSKGLFGVCSRNIWYKVPCHNNWWNIALSEQIQERLENFCNSEGISLAIQGEIVGPGIQSNRYQLEEKGLYVFNIWDIDHQQYLNLENRLDILGVLGLKSVPVVDFSVHSPKGIDYIKEADGQSKLCKTMREGLVFRDVNNDAISFKAISNKFLLKQGDRDEA